MVRSRFTYIAWAFVSSLLVACSDDAANKGEDETCIETTLCGGRCVDTASDPAHCGDCDRPCEEGQRCEGGMCRDDCKAPARRCGDACVDVSTDASHCGTCDRACSDAETCIEGVCVSSCPDGQQACEGLCVDISSSPQHCGACNQSCPADEVCVEGSCRCPNGQTRCDGVCVDTETRLDHCGSCDAPCLPGTHTASAFCEEGICRQICEEGYADCDDDASGSCETSILDDPAHCGACGRPCIDLFQVEESLCLAGVCHIVRCAEGWADCNGDTSDGCEQSTAANAEHCGACNALCSAGANAWDAICSEGVCDLTCVEGWGDCDGSPATGCEANLLSDPVNCSECGRTCPWLCSDGSCVEARAIEAGASHSCALLTDGGVLCWGANDTGQLGLPPGPFQVAPVVVPDVEGLVQLSVGDTHACGRSEDGTVWCWGANGNGQIGDGTTTSPAAPKPLSSLRASWVSAGVLHTCAIQEGEIWCWGSNDGGQLGPGDSTTLPRRVASPGNTFIQVGAGSTHNCALTADKRVLCWGDNAIGQLGTGDTEPRTSPTPVPGLGEVVGLAVGLNHSCAWTKEGQAWCWGYNTQGQLGDGLPIPDIVIRPRYSDVPILVVDLTGVLDLSLGPFHSCAQTTAGPRCWGLNSSGQLGNGATRSSSVPVPVSDLQEVVSFGLGSFHTCGVSGDGVPFCWGSNVQGQLGNHTTDPCLVPVRVEGLSP